MTVCSYERGEWIGCTGFFLHQAAPRLPSRGDSAAHVYTTRTPLTRGHECSCCGAMTLPPNRVGCAGYQCRHALAMQLWETDVQAGEEAGAVLLCMSQVRAHPSASAGPL